MASCSECLSPLAVVPNVEGNLPPKLDEVQREREAGKRLRATGAVILLGGIAVTLSTYLAAVSSPYGGHYVVTIGAICYGAMRFFQGHAMATGRIEPNDRAQPLLNLAARLEDVDREKAVAVYQEIVKRYPGTPASDEAQRNIQVLTAGVSADASKAAR
jgi:hypothetical protein